MHSIIVLHFFESVKSGVLLLYVSVVLYLVKEFKVNTQSQASAFNLNVRDSESYFWFFITVLFISFKKFAKYVVKYKPFIYNLGNHSICVRSSAG